MPVNELNGSETRDREVEIVWRETAPDNWVARVKDPRTERQWEVHSVTELLDVLQNLIERN